MRWVWDALLSCGSALLTMIAARCLKVFFVLGFVWRLVAVRRSGVVWGLGLPCFEGWLLSCFFVVSVLGFFGAQPGWLVVESQPGLACL